MGSYCSVSLFPAAPGPALGVFLPGADCAGAKVRQTRNGAQDAI